MTKTKQTVEQLLARRMEKVNRTKEEWERKETYAQLMASYAAKAKEAHLIEVEKAERMKERIAEGKEAERRIIPLQAVVDDLNSKLDVDQKKLNVDWQIAVGKLEDAKREAEKTRDEVAKMFYGFA